MSTFFKPNPESRGGVIALRRLPFHEWGQQSGAIELMQDCIELVTSGKFPSVEILLNKTHGPEENQYTAPTSNNFGETILIALTALKRSGYLANPKCIFTIERVLHLVHADTDNEKWHSLIECVRVANPGSTYIYHISLFWIQGSIMFNRENLPDKTTVSVHQQEVLAEQDDQENLRPGSSFETVTMDVNDFASMIARREILGRSSDTNASNNILAVLMASHPVLGRDSQLGLVPSDLLPVIMQQIIPQSVWAAMESGLVRL